MNFWNERIVFDIGRQFCLQQNRNLLQEKTNGILIQPVTPKKVQ